MNNQTNDDKLGEELRTCWVVKVQRNPQFRASVWNRIEARKTQPVNWFSWLRIHRMAVSGAAMASMVLAVGGAGLLANHQMELQREQLLSRYVASIDPHVAVNASPQR